MNDKELDTDKPLSEAEKSGLAKKKAINKAASYFSDDDSLFEFEGFEIETLTKDIDELNKKEQLSVTNSEEAPSVITANEKTVTDTVSDSSTKKEEKTEQVFSETDTEKVAEKSSLTSSASDENIIQREKDETVNTETEKTAFTEENLSDVSSKMENGPETSFSETFGKTGELQLNNSETEDDDTASITTVSVTSDNSETSDESTEEIYSSEQKENEYGEPAKKTENLFDRLKNNVVLSSESVRRTQENDDVTSSHESEHLSVNAEGQLRFDGTYDDELLNDTAHYEEKTEDEEFTEEITDEIYDEDDLDNEIWDRAGKEEWKARESFLSYCKSLTLPPPINANYGTRETETVKSKATSSGYRYAVSERAPVFFDGMYGGVDKAGYAERELHYCEKRKTEHDVPLREATRSLHRAMLYTALILLTVFLIEALNLFISGQTVLFASIEIGLTVLAAVFVWKGLADGIKNAVKGTFIPEIFAFLTLLLSLGYGFMTVFSASVPESSTVLIGLPAVGALFLMSIYRSLMSKREKKVFDITADYGSYCTEVRLSSFKGSPEEIAFGGYAGENCALYKTNRISRSDGSFNFQPVRDECYGLVKILLICVICAAIASGLAFGFINRSPYYGIFSAYLLVCLSCPFSVFLSLSLPRYTTALDTAEDGAAITDFDDESDELDESVIMLSEEELFPPEKIRILDTYWTNSHFLETHLSKAATAFRRIGGLLSGLFSSIDLNPANYGDVVITDISDGGITVKVGDSLVRAGNEAYLEKHGIEIERYPDIPQKDTRVLYIANNGEFFSRIAIQFTPDEKLCSKIAELRQSDTLFSLKTCNPCIDSSLVFYTTGLEPELIRTVKYMIEDTVCNTDTDREGILISKTGARGLLSALLGYKRQKKLILIGVRLAALSGLAGLALSLSISLIGAKWSFISFIILGFHAIMSGTAALIGLSGKKQPKRNGRP